jgi:deoxyribonuclease V
MLYCCTGIPHNGIRRKDNPFWRNKLSLHTGVFSFREGEGTIRAYQKLTHKPDLLMINACGITHPANAGFTSHIGVFLNKPTIGITKRIFCGRAKIPQKEIEAQPLYHRGKQNGWLLKVLSETKPIVVTIGHLTSIRSCLNITKSA